MRIRLSLARRKVPNDAPILFVALQHPLVDAQPFQANRPPGMRLARRDPHLRTQAETLSVGKPRRGVDEHVGGRDSSNKVRRVSVRGGQDRIGVMGRVLIDMIHRGSNVGDGLDREFQVEVFGIESVWAGLFDERIGAGGLGEGGIGRRIQVEDDLGGEEGFGQAWPE
jgi:hypothetical protein